MLKKPLTGILIIMGLALMAAPAQADQWMEVTPSLGFIVRHTYFWTLGLSVDFYLFRNFSISPEFFMSNKYLSLNVKNDENMTDFRPTYFLQPGVMLNYHQPNILAGAGVVYSNEARYAWQYEGSDMPRTVVWDIVWTRIWNLKLNMGVKFSKIRFMVSFLHPFQDFGWFPRSINRAFSLTLGYTF